MLNTEANNSTYVVAGLIRDPENPQKIFITRRKQGQHLENFWEFPGGKVERGESRFHALRRELKEEVGIEVVSAIPFHSVFHRYEDKKIHLDVWQVKNYQGQAHGREGQETNWISLDQVNELSFPEADIPVLKALRLPGELLITPDMSDLQVEPYVEHLHRLMQSHPYALLQFRSHHLNDRLYADVARQLQQVCDDYDAKIIINRPKLKSLQSNLFDDFNHRHLNSYILQSLTSNPFDDACILSASCHDGAELKMAERLNCQFAVLSSIRVTLSHPGRVAKGWYQFKHLTRQCSLPVYALGGVRRKDYHIARFQGAIGVAGISDFWTV